MNMNTENPTIVETRELIAATCDPVALGNRCDGLSRIAGEYDRLRLVKPDALVEAIDMLRSALDVAIQQADRYAAIERDLLADEEHDANANAELWEG